MSKNSNNALVFIDTNIILDFYRYPNGSAVTSALKHIDENHEKIITSTQVEMEYKKNRQKIITQSESKVQAPNKQALNVPVILENLQAKKMIDTHLDEIKKQSKKLTKKIEKILTNPKGHDDVYKTVQRLFKNGSALNLKRPDEVRFEIRELAQKRFILGYPPRKNSDNSIGDAINWEWVIYCASKFKTDVVIVSRDTDYGCNFNGEMIINDWLLQEFKERVGRKELILTNKLMRGFKLAGISVKQEEVKQENTFLELEERSKKTIEDDDAFFDSPEYSEWLEKEIINAYENLDENQESN